MHIFIDEAGDFAIPASADTHRVAVAGALTFTDPAWASARSAFGEFKKQLLASESLRGEPKWHRLSPEHRQAYCRLLADVDGVAFTPVTLDLSHLASSRESWIDPFLNKLDRQPDLMVYDTAKRQIAELAKQARNLSHVQHLRVYAWAYCLFQALQHAIMFLSHGDRAASWNSLRIEIDPVQPKPLSREQRVFSLMVLAWQMGWSRTHPFSTIEGIHTADHPFVRNFEMPGGVDLGKLVRPNLHWRRSHESDGLQMVDLATAAVYDAATELKGEAVSLYAAIMKSSPYGWRRGPGLFSPLMQPPDALGLKYLALSDAMKPR